MEISLQGQQQDVWSASLTFLVGIPITVLFLQAIGKAVSEHQNIFIITFEQKALKRSAPIKHVAGKSMVMTITAVYILILTGAAEYSYRTEGRSTPSLTAFLDGIYVWTITFTTIGFGDLVTATPSDNTMGLFQPVFTMMGLCAVTTALNNVLDCINTSGSFFGFTFGCGSCCTRCGLLKVSDESRPDDVSEQ